VNSHTGKLVRRLEQFESPKASICCLGWGLSFVDSSSIKAQLMGAKDDFTLDDVVSKGLQGLFSDLPIDLPADLAATDIETSLPKLSLLPAGSKE
jgi:anaphase-promoting complex subunit 4